jgi:hypothetical protein
MAQQGFNPYKGYWEPEIKRSPFRAILNKFSLNVSGGYGATFYKHDLGNSAVLDNENQLVILSAYGLSGDSLNYSGVVNWLNNPQEVNGSIFVDSTTNYAILSPDSGAVAYNGIGSSIPITVSIHLDLDRFRVGAGITYELHGIKRLKPVEQGAFDYRSNFSTTRYLKYFATFGGMIYNWKGWVYHADLQIGATNYNSDYGNIAKGMFFNIGVPIEYRLSEYFFFFARPSFEYKRYTVNLPQVQGDLPYATSVSHPQPALFVNFGIRLKFPEVPRCPIKSCKTQMKHVHGNHEYRGQPFYKEQNPKIGELYPEFYRLKGKNKRQLDGGQ